MMNCEWINSLTKYDCRQVIGLDGVPGLEIGTPFSLPGGSSINLYVMPAGDHFLITDNGDSMFQLTGIGLDVWQGQRFKSIRHTVARHNLTLAERGDFQMVCQATHLPIAIAKAITGLLALSDWAASQLDVDATERDIIAEAEPYIIARNPTVPIKYRQHVRGASQADHVFDFKHGIDLIDVIAPNAISTGGVMRKVGDVNNGPFGDHLSTLIIVDDREDPSRAAKEIGILASITRAQSFTSLMSSYH